MIVHLKNLIHPSKILLGSTTSVEHATAVTKRALNRRQLILPLLLRSSESGIAHYIDDSYHQINSNNKIRQERFIDPMRVGSCGSDRNSFPKIDALPLIAAKFSSSLATTTAACCWSVWILLLLSAARNSTYRQCKLGRSSSWGSGILSSAATASVITRSMSSYSTIFADAFHPPASHSSNGNENDEDDDKSEKRKNEDGEESSVSKSETDTLPENTCDATNKTSGKPYPDDDRLLLFHFDSTPSTQDEAKAIAKGLAESSLSPPDTFCVTATSQSKGRGTTGRQWLGAPGNVFVTIGIPVDVWMTKMMRERKIPLTLLPLKVGELTASLVNNELNICNEGEATVTVKWPNDVLVDGKKISGTLIENASNWFLIGIGINVAHAPTVPTTGADYGRPSVSLKDYCGDSEREERDQKARDLGVQLAFDFHRWIYEEDSDTAEMIVDGWKRWLDWDAELTMRNDANSEAPRRVVKLLDVLPDGRIKVVDKEDGKEEILVSDYFV